MDTHPSRRRFRTSFVAIAAAGAVAATSVPSHVTAADDGPVSVLADDGPLDTLSPVLQLVADHGEISVRSGDGDVVVASGEMSAGDFEIAEGVLEPGATYTYDATEVVGNSNVAVSYGIESKNNRRYPTLKQWDPSGVATPTFETETVQDKASFSLATGQGRPAQETNGLYGRFWPLTEAPGLGTSANPNPGSKTVSAPLLDVIDMLGHDLDSLQENIDLGWQRQETIYNNPNLIESGHLVTKASTQLQFFARAPEWAAAADAAEYNIEGRNVLPSFAMTLTSDQSSLDDEQFELSTRNTDVITTAFPRRSGFGYRLLGYLEVPESGTYSFSPYSPGGTRAYLYDHRDDDLGRIEISAPGEWNARTETCSAHGSVHTVENRLLGEERDDSATSSTITRIYEFDKDDEEWYLPPFPYIAQVESFLEERCGHDHPYGQEVELEAGRRYPIDIAGWVGGVPGPIGMNVQTPDGESTALPIEWITPAPAGTIDFERTQHTSATLDDDVVASHVNGVGDELVTITPDGALVSHTRNGYGGWDTAGTFTDMVTPQSGWPITDPNHVQIREAKYASNKNPLPANSINHGSWLDARPDHAALTGPLTASLENEASWFTFRLDELQLGLQPDGTVDVQAIDGNLRAVNKKFGTTKNHSVNMPLVEGSHDPEQGSLELKIKFWQTGAEIHLLLSDFASQQRLQYDDMRFAVDDRAHVEWTADPPVHPEQRSISPSQFFDVTVSEDASWTGETTGPTVITLYDQLWHTNPGGVPQPHQWARVTLDHLAVTGNGLDAEVDSISGSFHGEPWDYGHTFSAHIAPGSGTARFDETAETLIVDFALTGTQSHPNNRYNYDGQRVQLTLPLVGLDSKLELPEPMYPSTGLAVSEVGETLIAATAPLRGGDVTFITKTDDRQPFSPDNTRDTTNLHDLYTTTPDVDPPASSTVSGIPQAVDVTADGNTATIVTPTADRVRVDIVDRTNTNSPWQIIGSYDIATDPNTGHAAVPAAVGRDGSTRHLALATVQGVKIYTNTGTPFEWTYIETLPNNSTVTAMDFDYWVDHLAIGQAGIGQVDLYERVAGNWTLKQTLRPDGDTNFGADVSFGFGLLAITDDADSMCTDHYFFGGCFTQDTRASGSTYLYPDIDNKVPWGDLSQWVRLQHDGPGTHVTISVGGDSVFPIIVGAVADSYGLNESAPGRSNPGTFRSVF